MVERDLIKQLKRSTRLPSPPGTALQILELCQTDDVSEVSIAKLSHTLAADPALSLRLLRYANSSLLGASRKITSVRDAVVRLGIQSVRLMSLSFSLISTNDPRACKNFNFGHFWSYSVACGVAARFLARRDKKVSSDEAFSAGLLSDIGKMVFAIGMPDKYAQVLEKSGGMLGETPPLETLIFGASYEAVGAALLEDWGIPESLARAVRFHLQPEKVTDDPDLRELAAVVGTASTIATIICGAAKGNASEDPWEILAGSPFFDDVEGAREAVGVVRDEFSDLALVLNLHEGMAVNANELEVEAGEVLTDLSMAAQLKSQAVEQENLGLKEKAWTDGLTGIANRAAFDKRLAEAWDEVARKGQALGLVMIDVDHFKSFNDTYGHQTGDAVLKAVASCLPRMVRPVDFVARYGGEEFAVIMPNADRMTAAQTCVRIRKAIEMCIVEFEGRMHRVTASLGAAILPAVISPFTPQMLIEFADKRLYLTKERGRNCCSMTELSSADARPPQPAAFAS